MYLYTIRSLNKLCIIQSSHETPCDSQYGRKDETNIYCSGKSTTMIVAVAGTRGWQVGCVWWCLHSRGTLAGGRTSAALSHTQPTLARCWLGGAACRTTTPCSSLLSTISPVLGIGFVYWKLFYRISLMFCDRIRGGDTSNSVVLYLRNPAHGLGN